MILRKKKYRIGAVALGLVLVPVLVCCFLFINAGNREMTAEECALRQHFIETAEKWLGCKESDGSHRAIIDLYNSHTPLAQGYEVQYTDSWCATFVSAVAIECGLTDIIPTECGCQRQIELLKKSNNWQESDNYIPSPGDLIYYSSSGAKAFGGNTGWSDHVGIVVSVQGKYITTIEGNYNDQVAYRHLWVGDSKIRGYGLPDFAAKTD